MRHSQSNLLAKMKSLTFFCIVLLGVGYITCAEIPEEFKEFAAKLHKTCVEKIGIPENIIKQAKGGDLVDDPYLKCYMKCTFEEAGVMHDGLIIHDKLMKVVPDSLKPQLEGPLTECGTQKGKDHCDTAYRTQKCYQEKLGEGFFLV